MMFIAAMAFSACDDDDKNDNITVPDAVSKALKDKYPAAMDIEWERKGNYFVADCWMDGREMDVWYDVQATWKLTETDILWEGLPPTVQTAFEGGEYAQRYNRNKMKNLFSLHIKRRDSSFCFE